MNYKVNSQSLSYDAEGPRSWGTSTILLENSIDLTDRTTWALLGYTIQPLFDEVLYGVFQQKTEQLLRHLWNLANVDLAGMSLEMYHKRILSRELHLRAVEQTKLLSVKEFPIDIRILEDRISEICHRKLVVKNPWDGQMVFHFRVIRPQQPENNPLHRDVWLEDYDNCINLYIPIAGSNDLSSLVLIPGSHHWPESKLEITNSGAIIDGVKFHVPAITAIHGDAEFIRPNPKMNEVLVFSPYLVHGGARNLNSDITRISIEVRLWNC
jgi:hypothetical protein